MNIAIEQSWKKVLVDQFNAPYYTQLSDFVRNEYLTKKIFPPPQEIFRAFDLCPVEKTRAVILGQDPYHGARQANGLCFSVREGVTVPPSLRNIYKEIESDVGTVVSNKGDLSSWAEQGVLMLNATLTVRDGAAASHQGKGWENFTDAVVKYLSDEKEHLVFVLWGRHAQEKGKVIDSDKHLVLSAAHPSPLSAYNGFFGCKHFSKTNDYLTKHHSPPIIW